MICPATLHNCCDDICSNECLKLPGAPPLMRCACGGLVGINGENVLDDCRCDADEESAFAHSEEDHCGDA
jgi:hypothetical protein